MSLQSRFRIDQVDFNSQIPRIYVSKENHLALQTCLSYFVFNFKLQQEYEGKNNQVSHLDTLLKGKNLSEGKILQLFAEENFVLLS